MTIEELFDENGKMLNDKHSYFDDDGDLICYHTIREHICKYPSCSDIVILFYAEDYALETGGDYSSRYLYEQAY